MDKVKLYLEFVPLPAVMAGMVAGIIAFALVPRRYRMGASIAFLMAWLVLGELIELQPFHAIAKVTGWAAYLLVAVTAWMHPGPKRQLPPMAWGYVGIAIISYIFILTVWDLPLAIAIRTQWFCLVIGALLVARTVVDERSLMYVMWAMTLGLVAALFLPFSHLLLHPGDAFSNRRFNPYNANPNHIGVLFALAAPFALFGAMRAQGFWLRIMMVGASGLAAGMGILTASRSTMTVMLGISFPLLVALTRRPIMTALAAVILLGGISVVWTLTSGEAVNVERFSSLETGRVELAEDYLSEVIAERPLFGLLESEGESFLRSEKDATVHPHNAYIETLYYGGIVFGIPVFAMVFYTVWCTFRIWKGRKFLPYEPLLITFVAAIMMMTFAHGLVNHSKDYPTTSLAFPHVFFSVLIMGLARDLTRGSSVIQAHEDFEWVDVDYEYEEEEYEYA